MMMIMNHEGNRVVGSMYISLPTNPLRGLHKKRYTKFYLSVRRTRKNPFFY